MASSTLDALALTAGQWAAISPDYRGADDSGPFWLRVDPVTLRTERVPVRIVAAPAVVEIPAHYAGTWPLDPRD